MYQRNSSSHESKISMHLSNDKTSERFRRAEGAINHFVLWPPLPQKNKLSSLEKFQSSSISSPLATRTNASVSEIKIFRNRPDSVHAMSILTIGNSVIKCFILRIIFPLYSPFFCRSKKILRFIIIIIIFSP